MKRNEIIIKFLKSEMSDEALNKFECKFPKYYAVLYAMYDLFKLCKIETEDIIDCEADDNDDVIRVLFNTKKFSKLLDVNSRGVYFGLKKQKYYFTVNSRGSASEISYHLKEND